MRRGIHLVLANSSDRSGPIRTLGFSDLLIAFALRVALGDLFVEAAEVIFLLGFFGHPRASCMALIIRAFSKAITL